MYRPLALLCCLSLALPITAMTVERQPKPDDGRPVPLEAEGVPPDTLAVRPLDDPLAPCTGRQAPFALLDDQPKIFFFSGGHRSVQNGRLKIPILPLIERWYEEAGKTNPITVVVPPESARGSDRSKEQGADSWGAAIAPHIATAAEADAPVVVFCDWWMSFLGWRDGKKSRGSEYRPPPPAESVAEGAELLERFSDHMRQAGADLIIYTNYPGSGGTYDKTVRYQTGTLRPTTMDWGWLVFAAHQARSPDRVLWGPNSYATNRDRPWLWAKDGSHQKDRHVLAHAWLIHLLRLDGKEVPDWVSEGFTASLRGEPPAKR